MFALPLTNLDRLDRLLRPSPLPKFAQGGSIPDMSVQKKKPGLFPQPIGYGPLWKQQGAMNPFKKALRP